jgi:Na+/H+-translocating membrane pyrophosphatase|tara:strand:- start:108 stop:518 length:411 start_codon:yes stop_codon:yes gene_type:complete
MTAAWTYLGKIVPLFLLFIWFFTCKHWWYHAILIPIAMYSYQLVISIYQDVYLRVDPLDTNQLIYLAPFFIIILSLVYLIRIKIFDRVYGIDLSEIDETDVSVFSPISETDRREVKSFQEEEEYWEPTQEEYYTRL